MTRYDSPLDSSGGRSLTPRQVHRELAKGAQEVSWATRTALEEIAGFSSIAHMRQSRNVSDPGNRWEKE